MGSSHSRHRRNEKLQKSKIEPERKGKPTQAGVIASNVSLSQAAPAIAAQAAPKQPLSRKPSLVALALVPESATFGSTNSIASASSSTRQRSSIDLGSIQSMQAPSVFQRANSVDSLSKFVLPATAGTAPLLQTGTLIALGLASKAPSTEDVILEGSKGSIVAPALQVAEAQQAQQQEEEETAETASNKSSSSLDRANGSIASLASLPPHLDLSLGNVSSFGTLRDPMKLRIALGKLSGSGSLSRGSSIIKPGYVDTGYSPMERWQG